MVALSFVWDSCRFGGGRASSSSVLTRLRFLETTSCCDDCVVVVAAVVVDRVVLAMSRTRRLWKIDETDSNSARFAHVAAERTAEVVPRQRPRRVRPPDPQARLRVL